MHLYHPNRRITSRSIMVFATTLLFAAIIGCGGGSSNHDEDGWGQKNNISESDLQAAYQSAIIDATTAEPSEIVHDLIAITKDNRSLSWDSSSGEDRVLVSTWTSWGGYATSVGQSTQLSRDIWVDPYPEIQERCSGHDTTLDALTLRLEQYIGLPPHNGNKYMVEMWVRPADMFRPAADNRINTDSAGTEIPPGTDATYLAWFNNQISISYTPNGYPWTRLGYTYDWGSNETTEGATEYVIRSGSEVIIREVETTAEYCGLE